MADYTQRRLVPFSQPDLTEVGYVFLPDGEEAQERISLAVGASDGVVNMGNKWYSFPPILEAGESGVLIFDSVETPSVRPYYDEADDGGDVAYIRRALQAVAPNGASATFTILPERAGQVAVGFWTLDAQGNVAPDTGLDIVMVRAPAIGAGGFLRQFRIASQGADDAQPGWAQALCAQGATYRVRQTIGDKTQEFEFTTPTDVDTYTLEKAFMITEF
jgi:hypothetical protein